MNYNKCRLKSNKGFTMQDAAVAIVIIMLLVGTVTGIYITIYKVQAQTKVDSVAMLFVVQIMERIDKEPYESVEEENLDNLISQMREDYSIPTTFNIDIKIIPDEITNELVKTVQLNLSYNFLGKDSNIVIKRIKVKEL